MNGSWLDVIQNVAIIVLAIQVWRVQREMFRGNVRRGKEGSVIATFFNDNLRITVDTGDSSVKVEAKA